MPAPERYLTPEQDAAFDTYVHEWARELGLNDWDIYRNPLDAKPKNAMADVSPKVYGRQAKYRTGNWTYIEPTETELARIALHETLHVFLAELIEAAESESTEWRDTAEHRVINVLTNLLTKE